MDLFETHIRLLQQWRHKIWSWKSSYDRDIWLADRLHHSNSQVQHIGNLFEGPFYMPQQMTALNTVFLLKYDIFRSRSLSISMYFRSVWVYFRSSTNLLADHLRGRCYVMMLSNSPSKAFPYIRTFFLSQDLSPALTDGDMLQTHTNQCSIDLWKHLKLCSKWNWWQIRW